MRAVFADGRAIKYYTVHRNIETDVLSAGNVIGRKKKLFFIEAISRQRTDRKNPRPTSRTRYTCRSKRLCNDKQRVWTDAYVLDVSAHRSSSMRCTRARRFNDVLRMYVVARCSVVSSTLFVNWMNARGDFSSVKWTFWTRTLQIGRNETIPKRQPSWDGFTGVFVLFYVHRGPSGSISIIVGKCHTNENVSVFDSIPKCNNSE